MALNAAPMATHVPRRNLILFLTYDLMCRKFGEIIMQAMEQRVLHGEATPSDLARALIAEFDRGSLMAQAVGDEEHLAVQITTRRGAGSGGTTALTVSIERVADGVMVRMGEQEWLGMAASLGRTTVAALMNPWTLLGRLDDIAQDVQNIQLSTRVWETIEAAARGIGAGRELSERLSRVTCEYCGVANPVGEAACLACGAPLGRQQPRACPNCGYAVEPNEALCPNCGYDLRLRPATA